MADTVENKKKRKAKRTESYRSYIHKVLKTAHPGTGISKKGMSVMESLIHDLYHRIARDASNMSQYNIKKTLTSREIQLACKLVLPSELAKYAVTEGTRAFTKFKTTK